MRAFINRHLIQQASFDSGALSAPLAVVHPIADAGDYLGAVFRGDVALAAFRLTAHSDVESPQVNIDLAELTGPVRRSAGPLTCECPAKTESPTPTFRVRAPGYALFYVSGGPGGFHVRVGRADARRDEDGFDSRKLGPDDLLAVTLVRPGAYTVTNRPTKADGRIEVGYVRPAKTPYRPADPVRITCTKDALRPNRIEVMAGQGQVYEFDVSSRIVISLEKPDDGPQGTAAPAGPKIAGWRKRAGAGTVR